MSNTSKVYVTVVADYQVLGDGDAVPLMTLVFQEALAAQEIIRYKILSAVTGHWGIQFVTFTVDMGVPPGISFEEAKDYAQNRLNKIVNDTDVNVRWVSSEI